LTCTHSHAGWSLQAAHLASHPHATLKVDSKWSGHDAANPALFSTEPTLRLKTPYRKLPLWQGSFETVQRDRAAKAEILNQHRKAKVRAGGSFRNRPAPLCATLVPAWKNTTLTTAYGG
jgi:hypothetical protein